MADKVSAWINNYPQEQLGAVVGATRAETSNVCGNCFPDAFSHSRHRPGRDPIQCFKTPWIPPKRPIS